MTITTRFFVKILLIVAGLAFCLFPAKRTHIMLEVYATVPALLQMIEFVQLPLRDKKIVGWHRFPKRSDIFPFQQENTIEISLKNAEGHYYYQAKLADIIAQEIKSHPDNLFVLHSNMNQIKRFLIPLLQKLSAKERKRIEQLHLYEDGFCSITAADRAFHTNHPYHEMDTKLLQATLDTDSSFWRTQFKIGLHKIIPTTYHLCHPEAMRTEPHFKGLTDWLSDAKIESSTLFHLAPRLTAAQKKRLYQLIGFDDAYWRSLKQNNNLVMFASGFTKEPDFQKQITALADFRAGKIIPLPQNEKETIWLYKPHPSYNAKVNKELVTQMFPDMIHIPAQLPLEMFVVADLTPDIVAGYDSSFFFNLPPRNIGFILYKTKRYLTRLKELNIIDDTKTLPLKRFDPITDAGKLTLHHPLWQDNVTIEKNRLTRSKKDTATILRWDGIHLTVQWDRWGIETFLRDDGNIYRLSPK